MHRWPRPTTCFWRPCPGGQLLQYVYFPVTGIVSLLYVTAGGNSAELAVVGCEGMIGVSLFMGGETTPNRAVVQSACRAYRLPAAALKAGFAEGGALQVILLKYTQALITQISQTAVCNLHLRWISNCAGGCSSAWIGCLRTSCT